MIKQFQHVTKQDLKTLLALIKRFEFLFDGVSSTCNNSPLDFELEDDAKKYV